MDLDIIKGKKVAELREIAAALKIPGAEKLKKREIVELLTKMHEDAEAAGVAEVSAAEANEVAAGTKDAKTADEAAESAGAAEAPTEDKPEKAKPARGRKPRKKAAQADEGIRAEEAAAEKADGFSSPKDFAGGATTEEAIAAAVASEEAPAEAAASEDASADTAAPEEAPVEAAASEEAPAEAAATGEASAEGATPEGAPTEESRTYDGRYEVTGILDKSEDGFGFLRFDNFLTSPDDVYVSPSQIRRFNLKTGDEICGIARRPGAGERFGALLFVKTVNDDEPGAARRRVDFSDLTPIYPTRRIVLENGSRALSMRLTDLVAPIGLGQRGLIVAPPKAGKTTLLKQIAQAIEAQETDAELIVLLIDERPEEVTDMQRSIKGRVIYSTFDEQPVHHVKVAEMVLARAQRLAEHGKNVIILLDSITRLARAYNLVEPSSGKTLSGGLDPAALYKPKKFFGAARNLEEGGSVTILATALVETGSRMDDMIFEEFKGTGNMELHLDRKLQEKRIFPAINLNKSGTRREDMLMSSEELEAVWLMRRALADWGAAEATEKIVFDLAHTKKNTDFIQLFKKSIR